MSSKTKPSHPPRYRNLKNNSINKYFPYLPNEFGKNLEDYLDGDVIKTAVANQSILKKYGVNLEHPIPFPMDIVILPILQTTNENDIVLDIFSGTGSVGEISIKINRIYYGIDLNRNYIDIQRKRLYSL